MTAAFGNQTNPWMDLDGSGGKVNSGDQTKMTTAFGKPYLIVPYPGDPFH